MSTGLPSAGSIRLRVGLTPRGWWFLGSGLLLVAAGMATGWVAALQFGAMVALLPMGAALLTRNPSAGLDFGRRVHSRELASGEVLKVTVGVRGRLRRGRTLLIEDLAPAELGGSHRLALSATPGQEIARTQYRVRTGARGVHQIGPMRIHVVDRFGMVHRVVRAGGRDEVTVHPPVADLDPLILGTAPMGSGRGHLGARGSAADDVIPRDYHPGDEVRRIDWKASARTGNLMVRSEEAPWRSAITVLVDLRESEHRGRAPESSVDVALSVAASIGCMALAGGWDLSVRSTDDELLFDGSPVTGMIIERRQLLLALATAPVSRSKEPSASLAHSTQSAGGGPLVLIAAALTPPTARLLGGVGTLSPIRIVVDVDADQWGGDPRGQHRSGHVWDSQESMAGFRQLGWRCTRVVRSGAGVPGLTSSVAQAWSRLGAQR